ncbi:hypothetical protein [Shigella phage ESh19]|nr:hypothetical protein [Shigella phage ESh19]URY12482.1 hypothetical protein [Shigella phage ESh20]
MSIFTPSQIILDNTLQQFSSKSKLTNYLTRC